MRLGFEKLFLHIKTDTEERRVSERERGGERETDGQTDRDKQRQRQRQEHTGTDNYPNMR